MRCLMVRSVIPVCELLGSRSEADEMKVEDSAVTNSGVRYPPSAEKGK